MYRFADLGRVWVPVDLPYPSDEGEDQDARVHVLFEVFSDAELDERERSALEATARQMLADLREAVDGPADALVAAPRPRLTVEDLLRMHDAASAVRAEDRAALIARTHDWRGIVGPGDEPVPFDHDKLAALLAHRPILRAMRDALYVASREGPRKNSSPGSAGSPEPAQA